MYLGPPVGGMLVAGGLCRYRLLRHGESLGPGKVPRLLRVPPTGVLESRTSHEMCCEEGKRTGRRKDRHDWGQKPKRAERGQALFAGRSPTNRHSRVFTPERHRSSGGPGMGGL